MNFNEGSSPPCRSHRRLLQLHVAVVTGGGVAAAAVTPLASSSLHGPLPRRAAASLGSFSGFGAAQPSTPTGAARERLLHVRLKLGIAVLFVRRTLLPLLWRSPAPTLIAVPLLLLLPLLVLVLGGRGFNGSEAASSSSSSSSSLSPP